MITGFILSLPAYLILIVVNLLPNGQSVPQEWVSAVYSIWSYANAFSFIVPVDTLLWALGIALTFHISIIGFKIIHWIITKIPFIG